MLSTGCSFAGIDNLIDNSLAETRYISSKPYVILTNLAPEDPYYVSVSILQKHRNAQIVKFNPGSVSSILDEIRTISPGFVCLVIKPESLDINLIYDIFDLSTRLDNDPFPDFAYGVITGSTADKARAFVENIIRAEKDYNSVPRKLLLFGPSNNSTADDKSAFAWVQKWQHIRLLHKPGAFPEEKLNELTNQGIIRFLGHGSPESVDKSLSYTQLRGLDLYPAIVFAGPCFSAVANKYYKWECGDKIVSAKSVAGEKSLALQFIAHGVTAYLGAMHENSCISAAREMEDVLATGAPLGIVMKHTYDTLIMANNGKKPVFPRLHDGEKIPDENAVDFQINRAAARILLGDPAYQPFSRSAPMPIKTTVSNASTGIKVKVQVNEPRMRFYFTDVFHNLLCTCDSADDMLYFRVELPDDFSKDYFVLHNETNCSLDNVKHGRLLWTEEYWVNKRYLHIQIGFTHDSIDKKGQEFYFQVKEKR
jgi:hypothetical protein